MARIKTDALKGAALDWAVSKCEGYTDYCPDTEKLLPPRKEYGYVPLFDLNYSTDWAQGGPIIEREEITIKHELPTMAESRWQAYPSISAKGAGGKWGIGPTPLIAAMRCYVASKLGDELDVPAELCE